MPEWVPELSSVKPYWPFVVQVLVLWYLGQFFKKRVWTKSKSSGNWFYREMRDTLPVHPLLGGALWGALYPWLPAVEFVTSRGGAITGGLLAGVTTLIGHTALEHYSSKKVERDPTSAWASVLKVLRETVPERVTESPPPPPPEPTPEPPAGTN